MATPLLIKIHFEKSSLNIKKIYSYDYILLYVYTLWWNLIDMFQLYICTPCCDNVKNGTAKFFNGSNQLRTTDFFFLTQAQIRYIEN